MTRPQPSPETYLPNLRAMSQIAERLLGEMLATVDRSIRREGDRAHLPYGTFAPVDRLTVTADEPPSSRLTCDTALGYLVWAKLTNDSHRMDTACGLLRHAFDRQGPAGEFVFNYGQHEVDQVDLGTVLDVYGYFWAERDDLPADVVDGIALSTRRAIDYLKTMHQPDRPGIIRKRAADPAHPQARRSADYFTVDVLNGNALAATAYCRGGEILEDDSVIDLAAGFQANLAERFGAHVDRWWAYVESIETREMFTAETILYQAMTALYLEPLYRARPNEELAKLLTEAMTVLADITDPAGRLDWSHEARKDFVATPLLMLPAAAAALADVCDITDAGLRRLQYVADELIGGDGLMLNEPDEAGRQDPADELRQLWSISDLALIRIFAERADHAAAAS